MDPVSWSIVHSQKLTLRDMDAWHLFKQFCALKHWSTPVHPNREGVRLLIYDFEILNLGGVYFLMPGSPLRSLVSKDLRQGGSENERYF